MPHLTKEYQTYKILEHWKPEDEIILVKELTDKNNPLSCLFCHLYEKTKEAYKKYPKRKDGNDSFVHPLNLVLDLKKANITDHITLSIALIHDYVEEEVDHYKKENQIKEDKEGVKVLDEYESKIFEELKSDLINFCKKNNICLETVDEIIFTVKLLTRHKRHFYYRSVSSIFKYKDENIKERAIQVKLADRIHNIQQLKSFSDHGKIYQCFKNLFILNNTKNYLIFKYGKDSDPDKGIHPTEKLFKKCCKATYDAFLGVCNNTKQRGIEEVESMLHLAFRKFVSEKHGLWEVTTVDETDTHPMKLFEGIVRKYDARLHQEWDKYGQMENDQMIYCKKFFADHDFNDEQLKDLIDYKDAYALKEVVARLLYKKNYIINKFGCNELCTRGMKCQNSN